MKTKLLLNLILCGFANFVLAQDDPFAGRPTSPGADIASDKENIPLKKESFSDKLERYKSEGFKVAVVLYSGPITTKPKSTSSTTTSLTTQIQLEGSLPSMAKDFAPLVESFVDQMNTAFATDVFEVVNLAKIPFREVTYGKLNAWESTKYKMVVNYSATPEYDYSYFDGSYTASLLINLHVIAREFVNGKKGIKIKYLIRAGNLGFYRSESYKSDNNPGISSIDELNTVVNPPSASDLLMKLQKAQDEKMAKFIEKRKKK